MTLDDLVAQLGALYGNELVGIALYGSAARGEHISRHSDLNVLVVVERITLGHLEREGAVARAWREAGNPPPLTLTRAEWLGSADIFPIEYGDILAHHKVLAGTLPVAGLAVDAEHLRLQLEHEAMSKLLRLRHAVLGAVGDNKAVLELLEGSMSTMLVLLRAALRLAGETPPADSDAVCDRFTTRTGHDTGAVRRIVRHVRGTERLSPRDAGDLIGAYLQFASSFVSYVDTFAHPTTP